MAEAIGLAATIIAIVQISDKIVRLCKAYIQDAQEASSDMHTMLIEISMLKTVFESLQFLESQSAGFSPILKSLSAESGPIDGCQQALTKLEDLLSPSGRVEDGGNRSKRRRIKATWQTLGWPFKADKARKLLADIGQYKHTISLAIATDSSQDIKCIKAKTTEIGDAMTEDQRRNFYKWLQHTDPTPRHLTACESYESGTGQWMLRTPDWKSWLNGQIRCVWVNGIPGAGKTFLLSYLVGEIEASCSQDPENKVSIYYYCYFGRGQDETEPLLRWVVSQLCKSTKTVPHNLDAIYAHGLEPSLSDLSIALRELLSSFEVVYILIDALDESKPRDRLLRLLRNTIADPLLSKFRFLVTSRNYTDIESSLREISRPISMANKYVEADIRKYVKSLIRSSKNFANWPPELLSEVEDVVSKGAAGMFRWAYCQIHVIGRLKHDIQLVRKHLQHLPKDLFEVYDRILDDIPEDDRLFVEHALYWMCFHQNTRRYSCLGLDALLEAVRLSTASIEDAQNDRFYDLETSQDLLGCLVDLRPCHGRPLSSEDSIINLCTTLHSPRNAIVFAHKSVHDYLDHFERSRRKRCFLTSHQSDLRPIFMDTILSHMLNCYRPGDALVRVSENGQFLEFCLWSIYEVLRTYPEEISQDERLFYRVLDLFDDSKPHFDFYIKALKEGYSVIGDTFFRDVAVEFDIEVLYPEVRRNVRSVMCFVRGGFVALLRRSLTCTNISGHFFSRITVKDPWLSYSGSLYRKPLTCSLFRYLVMVRNKVSAKSETSGLILLKAAEGGAASRVLVELLKTLNPEVEQYWDGALDLLIQLGADVNTKSFSHTPLQISVSRGLAKFVAGLLTAGADPNDCNDSNRPLSGTDSVLLDEVDIRDQIDIRGQSLLWVNERLRRFTTEEFTTSFYELSRDDYPAACSTIDRLLRQFGAQEVELQERSTQDRSLLTHRPSSGS